MFLRKKQEVLNDQLAIYRERETPRYATGGGIAIGGFEGEGLLKNISASGCCLESVTFVSIKPGHEYETSILPTGVKLEPFPLKMMVNWTRSSETLFEAGFSLKPGQKCLQLERYVELLQTQGVQPEYGNMNRGD